MPRADMQEALETVLRNPAIWRADQVAQAAPGIPTAYSALDQALPEHGWPSGALTELLVKVTGTGELSLLLPALRTICAEGRGIALVAPPYVPQARAWEAAGIPLERMLVVASEGIDLLWATEQVLRSGECGAVLMWGQAAGRALNHRALQRLQLAASTGNAACFLYRSADAEASPSPAPLRIRLAAHAGALHIHLVKCRGAMRAKPIRVELFPAHWQPLPVQVSPPAPQVASEVHSDAGHTQTSFRPVLVTAVSQEIANNPLETAQKFTVISSASINAEPLPATFCVVTATHSNATNAITINTELTALTPCAPVALHRNVANIEASSEPDQTPTSEYWPPANVHIFSEPALIAAAPQWNAGAATGAPGSSPLLDAALFPAVHSETSVA